MMKSVTCKHYLMVLALLSFCSLSFSSTISAQKSITLATDRWPPFYGPNMKNGGYLVDLTKQVFAHAGYRAEIKFMPWNRALSAANRGIYDGLLGAYYTEKRAKIYSFSAVLDREKTVLVCRPNLQISYQSLEDLKGYSIGVRRGAIHSKAFDNASYLHKEYSNSADQNIRKLLHKRLDFIVTGKAQLNDIVQKNYPQWQGLLHVLDPPLKTNNIFLTIGRHHPTHQKVISDFNAALKQFKQSGQLLALKQQYNMLP